MEGSAVSYTPFTGHIVQLCDQSYVMEWTALKGLKSAHIPAVVLNPLEPIPRGMAVFSFRHALIGSKLEDYADICGFDAEEIRKRNPRAAHLGKNVLRRMQELNIEYQKIKTIAVHVFKGFVDWEDPLFHIIRKIDESKLRWQQWIIKKKVPFIHIARSSNNPFTLFIFSKQVCIHTKIPYTTGNKKEINCIDATSNTAFLRIKPNWKNIYSVRCFDREIEIYEQLLEAEKEKKDFEGLLIPYRIMRYRKFKDKSLNNLNKNRTLIYIKKLPLELHEVLSDTVIEKEHKIKIAYQITKGLSTLHTFLKVTHGDLNVRNVRLDLEGNAFLFNFGCSVSLNNTLNQFERVENDNPLSLESLELGILLARIDLSGSDTYRNFFETPNFLQILRNSSTIFTTSLDLIIRNLIQIDVEQRWSISQAFTALSDLYSRPKIETNFCLIS